MPEREPVQSQRDPDERGWPSSPHFRPREFACPHCGAIKVTRELLDALEQLRRMIRRPLTIVSGYRCPVHNQRVGGAPRSQHLTGRAADIPRGYAHVVAAQAAGFTGVGDDDGWAIHVDVRPGPPARWSY